MALDNEFFDSISIDVVKKKYYNANKVRALLDDIRAQAAALNAENAALRQQLSSLNGQKSEIGDTLMSAQAIAKQIVERANAEAAEIVRAAEKRRAELETVSFTQQEYAAKCVEECFAKVKRQHMECIETLNTEWQTFLCGLIPEDEAEPTDEPVRREDEREREEPVRREDEREREEPVRRANDREEETVFEEIPYEGEEPDEGEDAIVFEPVDGGTPAAPGAAEIAARIAQIAKELREIVGEL